MQIRQQTQKLLRAIISETVKGIMLTEVKCPSCGSQGAYVGIHKVECENPACEFYVASTLSGIVPEMEPDIEEEEPIDEDPSVPDHLHGHFFPSLDAMRRLIDAVRSGSDPNLTSIFDQVCDQLDDAGFEGGLLNQYANDDDDRSGDHEEMANELYEEFKEELDKSHSPY